MAALAMLILIVATLATGATRHKVYQSSAGRAGGRLGNKTNTFETLIDLHYLACIFFILVTYLLTLAWLVVFACCVVMTIFCAINWGVCNTDEIGFDEGKIDFYPFHFLFPEGLLINNNILVISSLY